MPSRSRSRSKSGVEDDEVANANNNAACKRRKSKCGKPGTQFFVKAQQ